MAKVIYYTVLKSLNVMNNIQTADYRDFPVVSTELVKFLSLNTSVEAVDRLETVTNTLALSFGEINKSFST